MPFGGMAARLQRDRLRAEGLGQHSNAIKYLNQDYEALKQECLESGTLFRDPQFPAGPSALGFKELGPHSSKTRGVEWKRPSVSAGLASPRAGLQRVPGNARTDVVCQAAAWLLSVLKFPQVLHNLFSQGPRVMPHECLLRKASCLAGPASLGQ